MIRRLLEVRREFYEKSDLLFSLESQRYFKGLKSNEVHCICFTGMSENPNITRLAREMGITTSGMTKITTRLVKKGYLEKYRLEGNKKEVYFSLTEKGREIYAAHEDAHERGEKREREFLKGFSEDEMKVIVEFFERNNRHLDAEIEKTLEDKE